MSRNAKKSRVAGRADAAGRVRKTRVLRAKTAAKKSAAGRPRAKRQETDAFAQSQDAAALIVELAAKSQLAKYRWKDDQTRAPLAYIKGMALAYARVYCKWKSGDAAALEMAKKSTGEADDALAWYDNIFAKQGMSNSASGRDTLRHLFVLLIGLGIRESSGRYCLGRYMEQDFDTADTAEAGLFQASYDVTKKMPKVLKRIFSDYQQKPDGFLGEFSAGISCSADEWKNWGSPHEDGYKFQALTKSCPAFAVEFAAVGLRCSRRTWGPIKRREAEIVPACDDLLKSIEVLVDADPNSCPRLLP